MTGFNGLGTHLGNIARLSAARTRSISAENPTGAAGGGACAQVGTHSTAYAARDLGPGWKVSPCVDLLGGEVRVIADIEGPGAIQHMWMTVQPRFLRRLVLRCHWDDEESPSVEVPLGDFFCQGWATYCPVNSLPVVVNPAGGLNSYWEMPFRRRARITVENLSPDRIDGFFYQITYALTEVDQDDAYLHAQWRRSDPVPFGRPHTILDGVRGQGQYVGTYLAWESHHSGWWGEGEIKFYLDDDGEWPTICGTGTEDYVGGAWAFEDPPGAYQPYSTPYLGMPQVIKPDGFYGSQQRFGLYRWHVRDPIRFATGLRVTIQALGFRNMMEERLRYRPLSDDVASTAFWYQSHPHGPFPDLPGLDGLDTV
ncbi:glycoside hydrolase family 172 protein [Nonomuraea sediminis]|uniref:glycoside hydrolase family 172 protein n=1 Tax=Nonomuraea sediminis TaxID=2835864 RepID=UPI001BDD3035|nr:glycoside hydrolase family 172 protein [Nonomuraea sediminis]